MYYVTCKNTGVFLSSLGLQNWIFLLSLSVYHHSSSTIDALTYALLRMLRLGEVSCHQTMPVDSNSMTRSSGWLWHILSRPPSASLPRGLAWSPLVGLIKTWTLIMTLWHITKDIGQSIKSQNLWMMLSKKKWLKDRTKRMQFTYKIYDNKLSEIKQNKKSLVTWA
jgi:hypothetical protein